MNKLSRFTVISVITMTGVSAAWAVDGAARDAVESMRLEIPTVQIYEQADRVTRVYGPPLAQGATAEESAELFLVSHADVFGVTPDDLELVGFPGGDGLAQPVMLDPETGEFKFYLFRYEQQRNGVPVYGSDLRLLVRNLPGNPMVLAASNLRDIGDFAASAGPVKVDLELAKAAVAEAAQADFTGSEILLALPELINFSDPEQVIWAGADEETVAPVRAITYVADNGMEDTSEYVKWRFVADAATGAILHSESLILFEDVVGNVSGMATPGPWAMQCTPSVLTPFPYASASISGGNSTYTDTNGDYVISNGGASAVTVLSPISGLYFNVNNYSGSDEDLSQVVAPPGPADFIHNSADTTESVRAQSNGYLNANEVRDFALTYNPAYPVIASQTGFPVNVNRTGGLCPGNAWYDGSSINFCSSSSLYANTSFASISQHEYGHHLVQVAGSGQDQYGEGMGDSISMLVADDPKAGVGFYLNDCTNSPRNADNSYQYPCVGDSHDCGQLLSGAIWCTRDELFATEPVNYLDIVSNLTVNSILVHTGSTITPQITIDYLTLDDTDGNLNNGGPHYAEIDAGFGAHNMPAPELHVIAFEYPNGLPDLATPNQATVVRVDVVAINGSPVAGTGTVSYRVGGGAFTTVPMTEISPNQYEATLPAADCLESVEYYFRADDAGGMSFTDPPGAPGSFHTAVAAASSTVVIADNFEADELWTVQNSAGLTDGPWDRGVPVNCNRGDPPSDYDGSGQCYLTDNSTSSCNSDVDGGYTYLISPMLNLSGDGADIRFALWYDNALGGDPNNDLFKVWVANDGGLNWVLVETIGPASLPGWNMHSFNVGAYVTPTATVQVRFEASDLNGESVVEAGIDAFEVVLYWCDSAPCPGDLDGDGDVDLSDLAQLLAHYGVTSGAAPEDGDMDGDGDVDLGDLAALLAVYGTACP